MLWICNNNSMPSWTWLIDSNSAVLHVNILPQAHVLSIITTASYQILYCKGSWTFSRRVIRIRWDTKKVGEICRGMGHQMLQDAMLEELVMIMIIPEDWKITNSICMSKQGCKGKISNYRPSTQNSKVGKW